MMGVCSAHSGRNDGREKEQKETRRSSIVSPQTKQAKHFNPPFAGSRRIEVAHAHTI